MSSSRSLFEALFHVAVEAVLVIDEQGVMQTVNPSAQRLFGYDRAELEGRNISMLMPNPMASEHDSYLAKYRETGKAKIIGIGREVVCKTKSGSLFPADLAVGEGITEGRRFFVGILRDLTEKKKLEQSLARREADLRAILEHSPVSTAVVTPDGRFLEVNPACLELTGYSREEMSQIHLTHLAHADETRALDVSLQQVLTGQDITFRHQCVRKDGETRDGTLFLSRLSRAGGESKRVLVQFTDETDRLAAERQLRRDRETLAEVSRLSILGEMTAGIAHEVNQPLGAISNYVQALRIRLASDAAADPLIDNLLTKISDQALRAGNVIRRLRSVAGSHQSLPTEALDTSELILGVMDLADLDARFVGVDVVTQLDPHVNPVWADAVAIQQVLLNLLRNAVEATAAMGEGRVAVTARNEGLDRVIISVVDQGTGVADHIADQIMQPFFTTKESGMGVGLALSQSLVEANKGRMWFENNSRLEPPKARGATFFVQLPSRTNHDPKIEDSAGDSRE